MQTFLDISETEWADFISHMIYITKLSNCCEIKPLYVPHNKSEKPLVIHFEIAQSKPSMFAMQQEQLKTQMTPKQQSTSHTKIRYSTIPVYQQKNGSRIYNILSCIKLKYSHHMTRSLQRLKLKF
jgi:hypothetical protein